MIFGPPDMGQRALPQPRRPWPFRSADYEAGYDAGFIEALTLWDDEIDPPTAEQAAYARSWGWDI